MSAQDDELASSTRTSCSTPTIAPLGRDTSAPPNSSGIWDLGAGRHGALSIQVLQEFYVNATRKLAEPLSHEAAVGRVRILSLWPLHVPAAHDVKAATELAALTASMRIA